MRNFSTKSITIALVLTLTLAATPSFAAGRQDRDRSRDHRGTIERIVDAIRHLLHPTANDDYPIVPRP